MFGICEGGRRSRTAKLFALIETFQSIAELSTEDAAQDLHGQKERVPRAYPVTVIWASSSDGDMSALFDERAYEDIAWSR